MENPDFKTQLIHHVFERCKTAFGPGFLIEEGTTIPELFVQTNLSFGMGFESYENTSAALVSYIDDFTRRQGDSGRVYMFPIRNEDILEPLGERLAVTFRFMVRRNFWSEGLMGL